MLWHIADSSTDPVEYSLITLHPTELARQITLLTYEFVHDTSLDQLKNTKSPRHQFFQNFFDRSIFYLRGVMILTKSLKVCSALIDMFVDYLLYYRNVKRYWSVLWRWW